MSTETSRSTPRRADGTPRGGGQAGRAGREVHVAIVGSGLAGLATAYLLSRHQQVVVTLFEREASTGMDSQSLRLRLPRINSSHRSPQGQTTIGSDAGDGEVVVLKPHSAGSSVSTSTASTGGLDDAGGNESGGEIVVVDVPMRSISAGYYPRLIRLVRHLGLPLREREYTYSFATSCHPADGTAAAGPGEGRPTMTALYGGGGGRAGYTLPSATVTERIAITLGFIYYALLALVLSGLRLTSTSWLRNMRHDAFCARFGVPRAFTANLLDPTLCAVCTCTEAELAQYPAAYLLDYRARTFWRSHYTTDVSALVRALHAGVQRQVLGVDVDVELDESAFASDSIPPTSMHAAAAGGDEESRPKVTLSYRSHVPDRDRKLAGERGAAPAAEKIEVKTEAFDHVVLAYPPKSVPKSSTTVVTWSLRRPTASAGTTADAATPAAAASASSTATVGQQSSSPSGGTAAAAEGNCNRAATTLLPTGDDLREINLLRTQGEDGTGYAVASHVVHRRCLAVAVGSPRVGARGDARGGEVEELIVQTTMPTAAYDLYFGTDAYASASAAEDALGLGMKVLSRSSFARARCVANGQRNHNSKRNGSGNGNGTGNWTGNSASSSSGTGTKTSDVQASGRVHHVGSYKYDGIPLLEGCVDSARACAAQILKANGVPTAEIRRCLHDAVG